MKVGDTLRVQGMGDGIALSESIDINGKEHVILGIKLADGQPMTVFCAEVGKPAPAPAPEVQPS